MSGIHVLILAGKRSQNPLLSQLNVENKAFISFNNRNSIDYVLDAIKKTVNTSSITINIPPQQLDLFRKHTAHNITDNNEFEFLLKGDSSSVFDSVFAFLEKIPDGEDFLVVTADNPLLTPEALRFFLEKSDSELNIGMVNGHEGLIDELPNIKRTWHKLNRKTWLSGSNLFYIRNSKAESLNKTKSICQQLERFRKKPLLTAQTLGGNLFFILKYFLQMSSVEESNSMLSKTLKIDTSLQILPFPYACLDVDKIEDYHLVSRIFNKRQDNLSS